MDPGGSGSGSSGPVTRPTGSSWRWRRRTAAPGSFPPEHLHPRQEERFEVLEGAIRAIVDGAERRYHAGETFDVPAGTRHQMTADEPSRLRWEVRPAREPRSSSSGSTGTAPTAP